MALPANFTNGFTIGDEYKYINLAYVLFWFSVVFSLLTFSLAIYVYFRILHSIPMKKFYVYKLIVFNGIANCLQYYCYMISNQMGVIPNLHGYFVFLMNNNLTNICQFLHLYSFSVQASSSMLIALNRLLSILRANELRNNDASYFKTVFIFSLTIPLFVSLPVFFTYCFYDPVLSPTGQIHYIPVVVNMKTVFFWFLYIIIMSALSNVLSGALAFQLMKIRRSQAQDGVINSSGILKIEQGLILSVICSSFMQLLLAVFLLLSAKWQVTVLGAILAPVVALYTGFPFWSLIMFVPSVRNCAFSAQRFIFFRVQISDTTSHPTST